MSSEKIEKLLAQLKKELQADNYSSEESKQLIERLEKSLDQGDDTNDVVDTALLLETHFAAEYPLAEKTIREIVNILSRMGI